MRNAAGMALASAILSEVDIPPSDDDAAAIAVVAADGVGPRLDVDFLDAEMLDIERLDAELLDADTLVSVGADDPMSTARYLRRSAVMDAVTVAGHAPAV